MKIFLICMSACFLFLILNHDLSLCQLKKSEVEVSHSLHSSLLTSILSGPMVLSAHMPPLPTWDPHCRQSSNYWRTDQENLSPHLFSPSPPQETMHASLCSFLLPSTLLFPLLASFFACAGRCRDKSTWDLCSPAFSLPALSWLLCGILCSCTSVHHFLPTLIVPKICNTWLKSIFILLVINLDGGHSQVHTFWWACKLKSYCQNTFESSL